MTRTPASSLILQTAMLIAILALAAFLSGCAAPMAVTVASLAADGASYAASGKSISDHALSAATGSDCSAIGMLDDGVLCRSRIPAAAVHVENETPPLAAAAAPVPPPAPVDNSEATFLALGAFPDWDNADRAVVYGRFYNPLIVPLETAAKGEASPPSGSAFWVVAGRPLASGEGSVPVAQAKSIGFDGARTIVLCRATYRPGPCASEEPDLAAQELSARQAVASNAPSLPSAPAAAAPATVSSIARRAPIRLNVDAMTPTQLAQRPAPPDTDTLY